MRKLLCKLLTAEILSDGAAIGCVAACAMVSVPLGVTLCVAGLVKAGTWFNVVLD